MKRKKRIGTVCKIVGCIFLLFLALFPIYWLIALAIRPTSEMTGHISILPHMLTFDHFKHLFTDRNFGTAITNSLKTTIGSLILSLAVGICAAYVLARRRFRFGLKKPVTYWILLVRVLPPVAFTIPLYTMFSKVGILNTRLPVMLACVLINVPLIIWFLISFFQDLPEEIEESAKVDGATRMAAVPQDRAPARCPRHRGGIHAELHVCVERVHLHRYLYPTSCKQHRTPCARPAQHRG